ncbi:adenine deaminase C-terminal domain-containing protein [Miniphocaeibacter massiliensis]|uniref:adenine deaminase C-terminal domain-containing protein n=1 Tax=Miniphocaeibacter massiliensis TaxID=2041841 RepID=UPI000C070DD5|nr:adenine deaminase C-terminal domain-containing protein [Miniphocaeibacter massiliensis]
MKRTVDDLKQYIRAGRAINKATLVVKNGKFVNVMTKEIYDANVAIYKDMVVAVGNVDDYIDDKTEIVDAKGMYITPGLIDGHIHSECSKMSITSYSKAVVPRGTTSMVSGLDEYISVSGLEGLQEVLEEMRRSPLKVFWGTPYKTPYTFPKSTVAFNITADVHRQVQKWDDCHGVWEIVREAVIEEDEDTLGAISAAMENNLPLFGCAPMARGKDLNGYLCSGVRLDHESYSHEEVVEKMRNGMHMIMRESEVTPFMLENIRAATEVNPYLTRRISYCTDDVTSSDILEHGHLDSVVRKAIKAGIEPITAVQMGTINSAEAYRLDHLIGSVSPGRLADILLVDNLEDFNVKKVIVEGKVVAEEGKLSFRLDPPERSSILKGKLKAELTAKEDFEYKVNINEGTATVLSMDVRGPFVRKRKDIELEVKNGIVQLDTSKDVAMVSVIERFGRNGNKSLAFCSGWNISKGAMASSAAPDDNNIVVMGVNAEDMSLAVNHLIKEGGGQIVVRDGEIVDYLPLPVGGIVSDIEPEEMSKREKEINASAWELGCKLEQPLMYMFFLPITAIPDYAITDVGPVDCINLTTFDPIINLKSN